MPARRNELLRREARPCPEVREVAFHRAWPNADELGGVMDGPAGVSVAVNRMVHLQRAFLECPPLRHCRRSSTLTKTDASDSDKTVPRAHCTGEVARVQLASAWHTSDAPLSTVQCAPRAALSESRVVEASAQRKRSNERLDGNSPNAAPRWVIRPHTTD